MITDNRVLFHRVANTLNYLDIKTVVVSAAPATTSSGYKFEEDLPGCRIIDIHEYLLERASSWDGDADLPVPRPLPQPDEAAGAVEDGEGAGRSQAVRARVAAAKAAPLVTRPDISTRCACRKQELRKDEPARATGSGAPAGW